MNPKIELQWCCSNVADFIFLFQKCLTLIIKSLSLKSNTNFGFLGWHTKAFKEILSGYKEKRDT